MGAFRWMIFAPLPVVPAAVEAAVTDSPTTAARTAPVPTRFFIIDEPTPSRSFRRGRRLGRGRTLWHMTACPSCFRDVAGGYSFCPFCGASLAAETPAREERKVVSVV